MSVPAKYRRRLPQVADRLFLTDGGIETCLLFHDGFELPHFAAFHLIHDARGRQALTRYYERFIAIAKADGLGFVLESPTWRASAEWGGKLGYDGSDIVAVNQASIRLLLDLRTRHESTEMPMVVSGCVGPRGDGYDPGQLMSVDQAADYHRLQIEAFAEAGADMVTAMTMTNVPEAAGIATAAKRAAMPVVVAFTVAVDGRLPTGQTLADAIGAVDAMTDGAPSYYMINCAHPAHFSDVLDGPWVRRIRGLRANASQRSHHELDESPSLDTGNPVELGRQYRDLVRRHPQINVLGGCCGTDHRHIECIALACRDVVEFPPWRRKAGFGKVGLEHAGSRF
ncbi:MAG: homocysteine S-methyltransferase family protein [Reyranella sp.]|uniref:homocysteine S-methyltransferase family protein n=1 Tax=Reyranella sp. TaxID=1929291 RepID=UPI003D0E83C1